MIDLDDFRASLARARARLDSARDCQLAERKALAALEEREAHLQEARALAQAVAERLQTRAHARISAVVTRCLAIFREPYEFRIVVERKRGKTEARFVLGRGGLDVDPLTASGGGVVDVAAFALRVAAIVMRRPPGRRLLVLDEPVKHLSGGYRPAFRAVLEALASELSLQVILVTHYPELAGPDPIVVE